MHKDVVEREARVIFLALLDSEIFTKHIDFYGSYNFENELFGCLAKALTEQYNCSANTDILGIVRLFADIYGVDEYKFKTFLADGMNQIESLLGVEEDIKFLLNAKNPRGTPRESDGK